MTAMTVGFWHYIFPVAFVSAIATIAFLAMQAVLQRLHLRLHLFVVLLVAALLVLPLPQMIRLLPQTNGLDLQRRYVRIEPLVELVKTPMGTEAFTQAAQDPDAKGIAEAVANSEPMQTIKTLSLYEMLPLVWLTGACMVLMVSAMQYFKFTKLLHKNSTQIPADNAKMLWERYGCETKQAVELRVTTVFATPISIGLWHPCVYVPADLLKSAALPYALRHECMHISHYHIACKLLLEAACVLQWFNPLAWVMQAQVASTCEYTCDELVTAQMNEAQRHAYGNVLLACATPLRTPMGVNAFGGAAKQMYRRLQAVLMPQKRGVKQKTMVLLAVVLVFTVGLFAACATKDVAQGLTAASNAQEAEMPLGVNATGASEPNQTLSIPNVKGKTEAEAKQELESAGLSCTVEYVQVKGEAQEIYEDYVVQAVPNPQTTVAAKPYKGAVLLQVSNTKAFSKFSNNKSGLVFYTMPNVVGLSKQEAIKIMNDMGMPYEIYYVTSTNDTTKEDVISTAPAAVFVK